MFTTLDKAEIPYPFGGMRLWAHVARTIHAPWFHVIVEEQDSSGMRARHMSFLSSIRQLHELSEVPELRIIEVDLVTPPYINNTARWRMEPLREIWSAPEPDGSREAHIHVLESGARYAESRLRTPLAKLRQDRLVFRAPDSHGDAEQAAS